VSYLKPQIIDALGYSSSKFRIRQAFDTSKQREVLSDG
jgi:hypothetical protein